MKATDLLKFVLTRNPEYHWIDNDDDVVLFIPNCMLDEWMNLLEYPTFCEEGIPCIMKYGYFCFYMKNICKSHGIEINDIFEKEIK